MAPRDGQIGAGAAKAKGSRSRRAAVADSATQEDQCHPKKIFVGGLAHRTTTQGLREHFQRHGPIVDAVVLRWPDGRSRGFGYVTFQDVAAATQALQEPHSIGGRPVDVKRAVPGTNKLFVGGLPQSTNAAELRNHFEGFGTVSDAVIMIDPATNRSRGFGFVCFLPGHEGAEAVTNALAQYESHRIRGKWIEVKSATPPHKLLPGRDEQDGESTPATTACNESPCGSAGPTPVNAPPGLMQAAWQHVPHEPQKVALPSLMMAGAGGGLGRGAVHGLPPVKPSAWAEEAKKMPDFVTARNELQQSLESLLFSQSNAINQAAPPPAAPAPTYFGEVEYHDLGLCTKVEQ